MGCGIYWQQIHELEKSLRTMEKFGIATTDPAYQTLWEKRGGLLAQVGTKVPRDTILLALSFGFSPGTIKLWEDVEAGWMSEARVKPGAPPVYHAVSDEVAMAILKKQITPELEAMLMTPDEYLGE